MSRGFSIVAQNTAGVDYIRCAVALCKSIKRCMPAEKVALITDVCVDLPIFDHIITLPYGDVCGNASWKLANDWQVYWATPWEYTIKLEADMYVPRNISWWWDILMGRDLVVATTIRDFRNKINTGEFYRKIFNQNRLPNLYNAVTYFRKSSRAEEFYCLVKDMFADWPSWKKLLTGAERERATTDLIYSMAATILGVEKCTLPNFSEMSMIHMKREIIGGSTDDWTKELIWELVDHSIRIETIPQLYPLHYHIKGFADTILMETADGC